jgi:8-oxo-dGTP diphosphatase
VAVDAVILKTINNYWHLLLIKRKNEPFKDAWALPGGFVDEHEDLEVAAARELHEETCLKVSKLEQLRAFGTPHRHPKQHVVSVAFVGYAEATSEPIPADDASAAQWFPIDALPDLAFDHYEIVKFALLKTNPL